MKILITGVAGFIGAHTALAFAGEGHEVTGIDNLNDYYDVSLKYARLNLLGIESQSILYNTKVSGTQNINFFLLDICDSGNLNLLFAREGFQMVIHLAAQAGVRYSITNPQKYIDSNIQGFFNVLECCRNFSVKHLVFASSSSVYGLNEKQPFEENDSTDTPVSLYAATKKSNELMAHTYSHLFNIPITGLRFFTVYGPWGRPDMALFMFTKNILEGKPVKVYNRGDLKRDFTYINDIVHGIILAAGQVPVKQNSSPAYNVYNIGHGSPVPLMDFIKEIEKATGKVAIMEMQPMQQGDVHTTFASTAKFSEAIGDYAHTNIESGIAKFVKWFKDFYSYN